MISIEKIRQKGGWAVGITAIALGLFVVGTDVFTNNSFLKRLFGFREDVVAEIGGKAVTYEEYNFEVQRLESDYQLNNNKAPGETERQGMLDQAWNQVFFNTAMRQQFEELGLTITDEEKVDMVQGEHVHPSIVQAFTDPATQKFDKNQVKQFLATLQQRANKDEAGQRQAYAWFSFESKLPDDRLRTKYEELMNKTTYVTKEEAQREYENTTKKASVEYAVVPFTVVNDSTVKITDEDLRAYLRENPNKYKVQETRSFDYVQFMLQASAADSALVKSELEQIKAEFATATNDTAFAAAKTEANGGSVVSSIAPNNLPADLSILAGSMQVGQVYGPFFAEGNYKLYKVLGLGNEGPFSARASHILFKSNNPDGSDKPVAKAKAEDILKQIKGGASFEEMARLHGSDGTAAMGGDLGWFQEGQMVAPFQEAVFKNNVGLVPTLVETQFGYHIIKVTGAKTNMKYKVATIQKNTTPSDETRDAIYAKANEFKSKVNTAAEFDTLLKKQNLTKLNASMIQNTNYNFNDVTQGRAVVRWAFVEGKIGQVSNIFEMEDRYLVAVLRSQTKEGSADIEFVRDAVTAEVRKQKKAAIIKAKFKTEGSDLNSIAKKYGPDAQVKPAVEVTVGSMALGDLGYYPEAVGVAFGLANNKLSQPITADQGVGILKKVSETPAPPIADLTSYKNQVVQRRSGSVQYFINEAVKEQAKVKDYRIKFQ